MPGMQQAHELAIALVDAWCSHLTPHALPSASKVLPAWFCQHGYASTAMPAWLCHHAWPGWFCQHGSASMVLPAWFCLHVSATMLLPGRACQAQPPFIASSRQCADAPCQHAQVTYTFPDSLGKPILHLSEARQAGSTFPLPPSLTHGSSLKEGVGEGEGEGEGCDMQQALEKCKHQVRGGSWKIPSQLHFYMEPQTVLAQGDGEGGMEVTLPPPCLPLALALPPLSTRNNLFSTRMQAQPDHAVLSTIGEAHPGSL